MDTTIQIKDLDKLMSKFDKLSEIDMEDFVTKATTHVHGQAKQLAPVDKGGLRNSIHMTIVKDTRKVVGCVFTNLEYAPFVEFGTGIRGNGSYKYADKLNFSLTYNEEWPGMVAQPYMYPALKSSERLIRSEAKKYLHKDMQNIFGGGK